MTDESETSVNVSKLRELAVRGKEYREKIDVEYYGEETTMELRPLVDIEFLPIAAYLEEKLGFDAEEAQEMVEEERVENDGSVDASNFDAEFVGIMQEAAILAFTDCPKQDAEDEGMTEAEWEDQEAEIDSLISSLQGGKSLEIAERVLDVSSDAESAKSFRRDGGGE